MFLHCDIIFMSSSHYCNAYNYIIFTSWCKRVHFILIVLRTMRISNLKVKHLNTLMGIMKAGEYA